MRIRCQAPVDVTVRTPIHPTEDPDTVAQAASSFLPGDVEVREDGVTVRGHDLTALRQRIWELRIIDTFRGALLGGIEGDAIHFVTSKQAAAAGKVSLPASPHPLGDLAWTVRLDDTDPFDAEGLCWWLCPETADGEIVGPV